jgi:hypothetical protein
MPARPSAYRTSGLRVGVGLIAGILVAGALLSAIHILYVRLGLNGPPEDRSLGAFFARLPISVPVAAIGILLASPLWWLLHRTGRREWWWAVTLGAVLPGVMLFGLLALLILYGAPVRLITAAVTAAIAQVDIAGGVAGWVVWRVAYVWRPDRPEDVF